MGTIFAPSLSIKEPFVRRQNNKVGLFQLAGLSKDVVHLCSHGAFQDARSEYLIIGDEGFERERMYHEISLPSGTTYAKPASVPL